VRVPCCLCVRACDSNSTLESYDRLSRKLCNWGSPQRLSLNFLQSEITTWKQRCSIFIEWSTQTREKIQPIKECSKKSYQQPICFTKFTHTHTHTHTHTADFEILRCVNPFVLLQQVTIKQSVSTQPRFWWGNQTETDHLEDPGVNGRIILR